VLLTSICYRLHVKLAFIALILLLAGCPRGTRKTLVPDVPQHGDSQARSRFLEAKSRFLRDGGQAGDFKRIIEQYPSDPIVPWAELYAGIAALKARNFADADAQLTSLIERNPDPGLTARAELFLGITKNYEGDSASARKLLAKSERAIENDDDRTEYLAAVAYSTAAGERPLASLPVFDQLFPRVTPTERALIVARCQELVAALDRNTLERLFDEIPERRGPAIGAVGSRLAIVYDRSGDAARAQKMRENMVPVRQAIGLPRTITESEVGSVQNSGGDAGLLGAVVPLGSKKENRVAEQAVAGLGLAAGAPDGKGVVAIETRAAVDKTTSAEAVDALAQKNVIAIIGPIGKDSVDGASARAENLGVPMISLSTSAEQRPTGRFIFHIRHSPEHRARTLAQRALAKGIKTFAIMAPDTAYGKGISAAFIDAIKQGGGTIVTTVSYPDTQKSFTKEASSLKSGGWDAVFIADEAKRVGLIVPALAAAGNVAKAQPWPKKLRNGRPIMVLSTAEGLDASYLADAGRHSEGALFAPGFYPDAGDATQKPFIDRFVAAYSRQPEATEAYAFDAAQIAAAAGANGRASLAAALAKGQLQGVTGSIQFSPEHRRSDAGVLYTVVEETGGVFAIRVAK
jgi:ABC-type branched-subunit amino acid transport system substrate-binding protein